MNKYSNIVYYLKQILVFILFLFIIVFLNNIKIIKTLPEKIEKTDYILIKNNNSIYKLQNGLITIISVNNKEQLLDIVIKNLNQCENYGDWTCRKILDSNNKYSYGGLMFQFDTFKNKGIKYGFFNKNIKNNEVLEKICDKNLQIIIAKEILKQEKQGFKNWKNCFIKSKDLKLSYKHFK